MPEPLSIPPTTEWPPHLIEFLKAVAWKRLLGQHEGIHGVTQWLFAWQVNPLNGERIPVTASIEFLYPIALQLADDWQAKRKEAT